MINHIIIFKLINEIAFSNKVICNIIIIKHFWYLFLYCFNVDNPESFATRFN